ncbi:hypothetical protein PVK06_007315 [Gossypium arboreum]|uniref:MULE transposase domain-containing protein n=1 Tax=Gossypium arboreum TaxID=29729 RepID=A0ABR0QIE1_GOSAR|nr:hypothetical protein PVK06_007315 [Gossypium arboreum]
MHSGWDASYNKWMPSVPPSILDLHVMLSSISLLQVIGTNRWLRRHVYPQLDICVISNRGTRILSAIEQQESLWHRTYHWYCLRHIASNYYQKYCSIAERAQVTDIDPISFVDEVYKLENLYNAWRHVFPPVPDERGCSSSHSVDYDLCILGCHRASFGLRIGV